MSSTTILWELEAEKVKAALKRGERIDKRALNEYRKITIQKNISENANGSAKVDLGKTSVVFGVKPALGEPYPDSPDEGSISVGMELLPLSSAEYEPGPPKIDAIEVSRVVDRGIRESGAIDFKDLCLKKGEEALVLFIDGYSINDDGNLYDAGSLAALASLVGCKLPKVEDGKIIVDEYAGELKLKHLPLLTTFGKIGNTVVVDPNMSEWKSMNARFTVGTLETGEVSAYQKGGAGSFTSAEVDAALDIAIARSKENRKLLK